MFCSTYSSLSLSDNALGRCEEYDPANKQYSSHYVYDLDRKTLQLLERELDRLSEEGLSWNDLYAQCILKTILNDRPRIVYDPSKCEYSRYPASISDYSATDAAANVVDSSLLPTTVRKMFSNDDNRNKQKRKEQQQQKKQTTSGPIVDVDLSDQLKVMNKWLNECALRTKFMSRLKCSIERNIETMNAFLHCFFPIIIV